MTQASCTPPVTPTLPTLRLPVLLRSPCLSKLPYSILEPIFTCHLLLGRCLLLTHHLSPVLYHLQHRLCGHQLLLVRLPLHVPRTYIKLMFSYIFLVILELSEIFEVAMEHSKSINCT